MTARRYTHAQVVDAAIELVRSEGVGGFSLRGLGRALGIEAMSLYSYFASKDDLMAALVQRLYGAAVAGSVAVDPTAGPPAREMARAAAAFLVATGVADDTRVPAAVCDALWPRVHPSPVR